MVPQDCASRPTTPEGPPVDPSVDRRAVVSWCLFDWANSVFPTLIGVYLVGQSLYDRTKKGEESASEKKEQG